MAEASVDETRQWQHNQINGAVALIALTIFFVTLRIATVGQRNWQMRQRCVLFGWDDGFIIASLVAFIALCACTIVEAKAYLAYYSSTDPEEQLENWVKIYKYSYGISVIYPVACALPKLSICCMYLDLFKVKTAVRKATHALIAFMVLNTIAWFVPSVAVCRPISAYWSTESGDIKCIDYNVFGTWISLPHIVTDLIIMILPLPLLSNMHMRPAKKIGLAITFLTGSIGIAGGCLRLAFYIHRTYVTRVRTDETPKQIAANVIVSFLEPGMYLIAACLPRLRPLVSRMHDIWRTTVYPVLARSRESRERSPSNGSWPSRPSGGKQDRVPKVDVKLTGQGHWTTLAVEEEAISELGE